MTTELQKLTEREFVDQFRKAHPDWSQIDGGEKPDFRIQRTSGCDIGLEVVEYHADSQLTPGSKRIAVEARWWKSLWPQLEQARRTENDLRDVGVLLRFKEPQIPDKRDHQTLACELVRLIRVVAERLDHGQSVEVIFAPQVDVAAMSRVLPEYDIHPEEDWRLPSRHLASLSVARYPIEGWVPWNCLNVMCAWVSPDKDEFARILHDKARKSQQYELSGSVLWLLIVCETHGDLESHVFPRGAEAATVLETTLRDAEFDFASGPFKEVWLLSAFSGVQRRLYPPPGE